MRILLLLVFLLQACSEADSLGDVPPVEVSIVGEPSYSNGIGELLSLKCGYCHAFPLPELAPDNVVADLDLTTFLTRVEDDAVIRGADAIGRFLQDGLLDHDVNIYVDNRMFPPPFIDVRQMPLDYGTPVTNMEKQALHAWVEAGLPIDANPANLMGDASAGAVHWSSCNYCHGLAGEGLVGSSGRWLGPAFHIEDVTISKIQSMWLWSKALLGSAPTALPDQDAADLRAFLFSILEDEDK